LSHLAQGDLGGEPVALLDRAGEATGCRAVACRSPMGPAGRIESGGQPMI
jgi:hypothetical protein